MSQPSIHDVLTNTLSSEASVRSSATQQLETFASSAFPDYLQALTAELINDSAPSHIRNAAGLAIKNALTARESETKDALAQRWIGLQEPARQHIKNSCMNMLASTDRGARNVAGQVVSAIAVIELPHDAWPDLIDQLMGFSNQPNAVLKQATLQTIGYICESIVSSLCSPLVTSRTDLTSIETRNPASPVQQNFDCGCPRRAQGRREQGCPTCCPQCPQQLARVCSRELRSRSEHLESTKTLRLI